MSTLRWPRIPPWAALFLCVGLALALSPNVLYLYGVHNDYEMVLFKSPGILGADWDHLLSIGRPIAALLCNLTMLAVDSIADFRWTRIFSLLTVCWLGIQMISICVHRLRVRLLEAVAIALGVFLVPAFIYSVLNAGAWALHLLSIWIAFGAYMILARSNVITLPFLGLAARWDYRGIWRQIVAYAATRNVVIASLVLQIGLYDFPPNALILTAFPVVGVLFSRAPPAYRTLIALRDCLFIAGNLTLYAVSIKLIYIPIVRLFIVRNSEAWRSQILNEFEARIAQSYNFTFNTDLGEMLARLGKMLTVSGDLWFLPQLHAHVAAAAIVVFLLVVANGLALWSRHNLPARAAVEGSGIARLRLDVWGLVSIFVIAVCYVISSSSVLAASGGFVTYRTVPIATALVAIVTIYGIRRVGEAIWLAVGNPPPTASRIADAAMVLLLCAAIAANFHMNYVEMRLARNEAGYFARIINQAVVDKTSAIVIVDPRPFSLEEDHPVLYDERGRWIPPYELGCFSSYCVQTGAIVSVLGRELGLSKDFRVFSLRGDEPVPGVTCAMLTGTAPTYPANASEQSISTIKYLRRLAPITCVTYDLSWRDLSVDLGT